ncbi:hypothetical protein [Mesorhizobium sp. 1M-11]|uniref:hypothetical protein n=1 Tax=Mesorhizobium sp. 1M-11 TaxID=1529006 RepID=UPI0006C74AAB|nr:hypothetical protein [Mesorhizobium sp. 1M-11]
MKFSIAIAFAVLAGFVTEPANAAGFQPVDITIVLSPRAAATLSKHKEAIIVSASYSGDPEKSAEKHADEIGRIDLGTEEHSMPGTGGTVRLTGPKTDEEKFGWIKGPVLINVNVYSARKSSQDNLLNCDFIDGPLPQVAKAPVTLNCSLIAENKSTRALP